AAGMGGDAAGDVLSAIENLIGTAQSDTLVGDGIANALTGGDGDDTLVGGAGADTLTGGAGSDTVSYSTASAGLTASLGNTALNTGDALGDVYATLENLTGSAHADTLYGDGSANVIDGGDGNDTLAGGAGADTLTGGIGTDTVDYSASGSAVTAYLNGAAGTGGDAAGDVISGVENLIGSTQADALYGNGSANAISGGDGDDTLVGGAGADTLTGGNGTDTADYSASASAVTAYLDGPAGTGGDAAGDVLTSIENMIGSTQADMLYGNANDNVLSGGDGDDTLIGGAGADVLTGGIGTDTADYSASASAITLNLAATGSGTSGDAAGDTMTGIENVIGSAGNDSFTLALGNNWTIFGGAGSDTVALAENSGVVTEGDLLNEMSQIETLDFRSTGTDANLVIDASFIQQLVGQGNSSHLDLSFDAGDTWSVAAGSFSQTVGADQVFYSDGTLTTEIARLTVNSI
ncbi:MAG: hypothetical protein B7Y89_07575, partial [Novosphingobium sp. 32-60-15]|uniref:calcium-binding protein n=2 Tax=unclassified Novosphingobium TaxID=2644732 RepID=UPI000BDAABD3